MRQQTCPAFNLVPLIELIYVELIYVELILEVVSVVVPISTEWKALRMCGEARALLKSAYRHIRAYV